MLLVDPNDGDADRIPRCGSGRFVASHPGASARVSGASNARRDDLLRMADEDLMGLVATWTPTRSRSSTTATSAPRTRSPTASAATAPPRRTLPGRLPRRLAIRRALRRADRQRALLAPDRRPPPGDRPGAGRRPGTAPASPAAGGGRARARARRHRAGALQRLDDERMRGSSPACPRSSAARSRSRSTPATATPRWPASSACPWERSRAGCAGGSRACARAWRWRHDALPRRMSPSCSAPTSWERAATTRRRWSGGTSRRARRAPRP